MENSGNLQDFEAIKARLEEIVDAVSDDSIPLDDALDLYEEAVTLGMRVSEVLEDGITVDEAALDEPEAPAEGAVAADVDGSAESDVATDADIAPAASASSESAAE